MSQTREIRPGADDARHVETVGIGMYFEDFRVGRRFRTVGRTITETEITNFVCLTGMLEVLFTDLDYVEKEALIKGRLAPGALVYSIAEGLVIQSTLQRTGLAFLKMELDIAGPTFAGDTIHVDVEVVEARPTSKPGRGIVKTVNKVINQHGATVLTYTPVRMIRMRDGN
ncbi:MAG: MaoC family dehydratase N-terminal domain-containing protein [Rhodospirillales bacterium]|nr:MaoC family dehydratase N-terminal domain-containing protein [Rhodospirillales bacterium]